MEGLGYSQRVCHISLHSHSHPINGRLFTCLASSHIRRVQADEEGGILRLTGARESTVPKAARRERGILLTRCRLQQHAKNEGKVVRMMPALSNETRPSQQ